MAPTKSKSLDEHERLAKNIKQIRKNIRKKHQVLTQNVIDEEKFVEKSLKPVISPLQQLVQERAAPGNSDDRPSMKRTLDDEPPMKRTLDDEPSMSKRLLMDSPSMERTSDDEPSTSKRLLLDPQTTPTIEPLRETVYESLPTVQDVLATPEGRKSANFYINSTFKGPLVRRYMKKLLNDKYKIDHVFGPYFRDDDTLMIGTYPVTFEGDDIIINETRYEGTPGLYELIFMKQPEETMRTEEDIRAYSRIIKETAAHLSVATKRVKSSTSYKYKYIIKPIIDVEGQGLMKPNYIHWDDVNELCERLHLLISSRNAGHSGHDNEILSIIEELHEAGIIKEDAGTVEAIFAK